MITKKEAITKVIEYLKLRKREYIEVFEEDKIRLVENESVLFGDREDEILDQYSVGYLVQWGADYASYFIRIDAQSGDILYTMSPTSWVEELEDE
jgi:hypothetical protein